MRKKGSELKCHEVHTQRLQQGFTYSPLSPKSTYLTCTEPELCEGKGALSFRAQIVWHLSL